MSFKGNKSSLPQKSVSPAANPSPGAKSGNVAGMRLSIVAIGVVVTNHQCKEILIWAPGNLGVD